MSWARAQGYDQPVRVVVLARGLGTASTDSIATGLEALGAKIEVRFDEVGYLRARLPVDRILAIGGIPGVANFDVDRSVRPADEDGRGLAGYRLADSSQYLTKAATRDSQAIPLPMLTKRVLETDGGYIPRDEIRADRLAREVPNADGRGVTIATLDGTIDFGHEAFQEARSLEGERIAKVAGLLDPAWYTSGDYLLPTLVQSDAIISPSSDSVSLADTVIRLPERGTWHLSRWKRAWAPGYHPRGPVLYLAVWRDSTGLWVDANRNNDLRDDGGPIPNINLEAGFGRFPIDTSIGADDSIAFAVAFDPKGRPNIYQGGTSHGTMVAGTAAGSRLLGSNVGGIAPGARLLSVVYQDGIEDFILAARDPRVDVITSETAFPSFVNEAGPVATMVIERLVRVYRKPIFIAAGNVGPEAATISEIASAEGALGIGAYLSARSYALNDSWHVPNADNLAVYSSRGPTIVGALKPDLVAPAQTVTAAPCSEKNTHPGRTYELPACYMIGGGTSNATPFAAGAAALLISAARLRGLPPRWYDARAIAWALTTTARRLPAIETHEQGAGLIQLDSAWAALQQGADRAVIAVSGPVETATAGWLPNAGRGPGIFLRDGATGGRPITRSISLVRQTGPRAAARFRLRWRGNDGTFGLADSMVTLPLDRTVLVPVTIAPRAAGLHSAMIEVVNDHGLTVRQVPVTVVAGLALTARNGFTARFETSVAWPGNRSIFIDVPQNTGALRVETQSPTGDLRMIYRGPLTRDGRGSLPGGPIPPREIALTIANPVAGTWEFTLTPRTFVPEPQGADRTSAPSLTATALRATSAATMGAAGDPSVTFTNTGAPIPVASVRASLGRRYAVEGALPAASVDTLAPVVPLTVSVDSGTTTLRASLTVDGDPANQVTLHLYACPENDRCQDRGPVIRDGAGQRVIVPNPSATLWKVVIDPARVRGRPARYRVTIVTTNPRWGTVEYQVPNDTTFRAMPAGATWRVPLRFARGALPAKSLDPTAIQPEAVGVVDLLAYHRPDLERKPQPPTPWIIAGPSDPAFLAGEIITLPTH